MNRCIKSSACLMMGLLMSSVAVAGQPATTNTSLSLSPALALTGNAGAAFLQDAQPMKEQTTMTTTESDHENDLGGPYFLRSADPETPGTIALKLRYEYSKSHSDEEHVIEGVFEWGICHNWEFILEIPVEIGDGRVEGNGDITEFGFHTRLWEEGDWMPAFAVRNLLRLPTGYHSDGVDYTLIGLFTKTLVPDVLRLHFNPFLVSINGNQEDDDRNFRGGGAIGFDYMASQDLRFIADYLYEVSEKYGERDQQSVELGIDWEFAEEQSLGLATVIEVDGDQTGEDFSARIQYMIDIPGPNLGG